MADNTKISLSSPIKQGDKHIKEIELRKPMAGELRGIKLLDIMQMDVSAYLPLLPRISTPALTEQQIVTLDPADLIQLMTGVQSFFVASDSPST
ncbi:phage tail protein [Veronia nyctiphanis]|uniref:Phage tail protein n=1 Tax=Veronia nyctiphanis TaxID=1278244 RepID=A0A4Q0YMW7_9GAMM|nr:phage tail assembly protein [Veronia nyctiphanis]RXJ70659.1 phage tail protein [Veronia nyctiphanis]